MRLSQLENGHLPHHRVLLSFIAWRLGGRAPDILKVLYYRPRLFGRPMNQLFKELLRGPSEWTAAERELIAAVTSKLNDCEF